MVHVNYIDFQKLTKDGITKIHVTFSTVVEFGRNKNEMQQFFEEHLLCQQVRDTGRFHVCCRSAMFFDFSFLNNCVICRNIFFCIIPSDRKLNADSFASKTTSVRGKTRELSPKMPKTQKKIQNEECPNLWPYCW